MIVVGFFGKYRECVFFLYRLFMYFGLDHYAVGFSLNLKL